MNLTAEENLKKIYKEIRHNALPKLRSSQLTFEPLPIIGEMRWGISIVLRGELPDIVFRKIKEVETLIGDKHTYYNSKTIHFTIRALEAYRTDISPNDEPLQLYKKITKNNSKPNFTIALKGIVSTASGLLLCGYPNFDLKGLRTAIYDDLNVNGLTSCSPEPNREKLRNTCHASLVVYGSEIKNNAEYLTFLNENIAFDFGASVNLNLEIVKYERTQNNIEVFKIS